MRVLTASQMRRVDQRAIEELGIPGPVLMENAAVGLADALGEQFPTAESVTVLCGPGNNGGDGLALVRHLESRGYRYRVFLVVRRDELRGDAKLQLDILENSGIEVIRVTPDSELGAVLACCEQCDVVVDALFGTGLSRPLDGHFAALVEGLEDLSTPLLAVDVPSGLDGSAWQPIGPHLTAAVTVTFAAPKVAHVLEPSARYMGRLLVTDLGIPPFIVDEAPGDLHLLVRHELASYLMPRSVDGHKGTFGHALVVAGSVGKAGAAILTTRAAVRGGAGLVTAAVPTSVAPLVDGASIESMTVPLSVGDDGTWFDSALPRILASAADKDAVAVGPGLGLEGNTAAAVRRLSLKLTLPLVLDADGLNAWSASEDAAALASLAQRTAATVLTPHPGEMARLLGISIRDVEDDRLAAVRNAAAASGAVVVLKGNRSLIADPEGGVWVNPTGNAALATGGSGDVLTGMLVGFLAQGYDALVAAQLAVYLHGLIADLWCVDGAAECLRAGDLVEQMGRAFEELRRP